MNTLEIKNIHKSFGGVHAVRHCTFSVAPHQITALIGPNGAGKTTLFNIVNGFLPADEGSVSFNDTNVTHAQAWERSRAGMSRTFQLPRLFKNLSLRDNLLLAKREDDDRFWRMVTSRTSSHAHDALFTETLRFVGLEKQLGAPVTALSYGEQKLFDLCRALINPHTFLLLDEPVAGVNPVLRGRLKTILTNLKAQRETILLIEHDMDFVRGVADYVIVMDQGSVLAEGKPEMVLRERKVLEAYLGTAH